MYLSCGKGLGDLPATGTCPSLPNVATTSAISASITTEPTPLWKILLPYTAIFGALIVLRKRF